MDWLYRISITCFAASYLVAFALEVSRIFFRRTFQKYLIAGITGAGFFAHTVYLALQTQLDLGPNGVWLGSWAGWCLSAAWVLIAAYLWISIRKPRAVVGLFLLPMVMLIIGVATRLQILGPFSTSQAKSLWSMIHGMALLLGTVTVALGFIFGIMYLIQAFRLKKKMVPSELFRLPSLEWLQRCSEVALMVSASLLGVGLISGIVINFIKNQSDPSGTRVPWDDPVVWTSGVLFAWLLAATLFSRLYQPARHGRKVAYLVVASFLFLVLELGIVWITGHAFQGDESNLTLGIVEWLEAFLQESRS